MRAVPEADRCADGKGRIVRAQRRALIEAKIAERPLAEIAGIRPRSILNREVLIPPRARHGQNDRRILGQVDTDSSRRFARLLKIKCHIPIVNEEEGIVPIRFIDKCLRREKTLVHVGADPVARPGRTVSERDLLTEENIQLELKHIVFDADTIRQQRCIGGMVRRKRKMIERRALIPRLRDGKAEALRRIQTMHIPLHCERLEIASGCRIGGGKHLPHLEVDRPPRVGTLPAGECIFRIALVEEILSSKDVRVYRISAPP